MRKTDIVDSLNKMLKYNKGANNFVGEIMDYSSRHRENFVDHFNNGFIKYYEIAFDTLVEAVHQINFEKKHTRPPHRVTQRLIIKNNLPTLHSAFQLLSSGFYNDSIGLVRSLYESVVRIFFISYHPLRHDQALGVAKGQRFNLTNFMRDDLNTDWTGWYRVLSIKAHSNSYQTLKDLIDLSKNGLKDGISIKLERNIEEPSMALNYIEYILWAYLYFIKTFLLKSRERSKKLTIVANGLYATLYSLHLQHPTNQFHKKCDETKKVFNIMKKREQGKI